MRRAVTLVTGFTATPKTHVQVLQTVPAEGVFAALAQHLRAALIPLDVGATHGALLDGQVRTAVGDEPAHRGREQQTGTRCQGLTPGEVTSRDMQASLFSEQTEGLYLAAKRRVSARSELG